MTPLCDGQPFVVCMLVAEILCFLRGGGETPPSSDSDDDASIASRTDGLYYPRNTNHWVYLVACFRPTTHRPWKLEALTKFVLLDDVT